MSAQANQRPQTPHTLRRRLPARKSLQPFCRLRRISPHSSASSPVAVVQCHRHAAEDDQGRLILETHLRTDTGKTLPHAVLEFKSTRPDKPPNALAALHLPPIDVSKFLWATEV
jgi:hypothetical protein